ncbi:MAG: ankyrin repeat domain-containing protein [Chlamydiota bacterium]
MKVNESFYDLKPSQGSISEIPRNIQSIQEGSVLSNMEHVKGDPNELTHRKMIQLSTALGYSSEGGICGGITHKGIEAILSEGMDAFDFRIEKIGLLFEKLKKQDHSRRNITEKKTNKDGIDWKGLAEEISPGFYIDLLAFFGGVELARDAEKYSDFFEEDKYSIIGAPGHLEYRKTISSLTMPIDLEAKGGMREIIRFSGVYSEKELIELLNDLKKIFDDNSLKSPIALQLASFNHAICVGYDPMQKNWFFIDVNKILIRKIRNEQLLASEIFSAFCFQGEKEIIVSSSLYCSEIFFKYFQDKINIWTNSDEFYKIHEVSQKKAELVSDAFGNGWLLVAAKEGHPEIVKALLNAKADADRSNLAGMTALCIASLSGHVKVVKALIEARVDLNKAGPDGVTALMAASQNGCVEVVKVLLEGGAIKETATTDGYTALDIAHQMRHDEIVNLLS